METKHFKMEQKMDYLPGSTKAKQNSGTREIKPIG